MCIWVLELLSNMLCYATYATSERNTLIITLTLSIFETLQL